MLIFPEGSRTYKAIRKSCVSSVNDKKLGELKGGAAWLALKTNARILPVWVEGTDKVLPNEKFPFPRLQHKMLIQIGKPFRVQGETREETTSELTQALLALADEE